MKIEFKNVCKDYVSGSFPHKRYLHAVRDANLAIQEGEILAVVGESGCGKTTMARMLMKLHAPTSGQIYVDGQDIAQLKGRQADERFRSEIQMIFQDPFASLNPSQPIHRILGRAVELHHPELNGRQVAERVNSLLCQVGLTPPEDYGAKYPAQLSGGQRQRIVIARALAVDPSILVADEPTSMLDVSIGIEIMNLLLDLKASHSLTMLYITHNLANARYIADHMAVMYAGNIMEYGPMEKVVSVPYHPYTVLLMASTPEPFREKPYTLQASEELPDLMQEQTGCLFCRRCPKAMDKCAKQIPGSYTVDGRQVKCFLYEHAGPDDPPAIDVTAYCQEEEEP